MNALSSDAAWLPNLSIDLAPEGHWNVNVSVGTPESRRSGDAPDALHVLLFISEPYLLVDPQSQPAAAASFLNAPDLPWLEGASWYPAEALTGVQVFSWKLTPNFRDDGLASFDSIRVSGRSAASRVSGEGWFYRVPEFGSSGDGSGCGADGLCELMAEDLSALGDLAGAEVWFAGKGTEGFHQVGLRLWRDWSLASSNPPPVRLDSRGSSTEYFWPDSDVSNLHDGATIWVRSPLHSAEAASDSQRRFLVAGVLLGFAGSIVAGIMLELLARRQDSKGESRTRDYASAPAPTETSLRAIGFGVVGAVILHRLLRQDDD